MKLTLLGTGCPSVDFKRCGSSNLISTKSTKILVDCGSGVTQRLNQSKNSSADINALLLFKSTIVAIVAQNMPANATVVNFGVSFFHLNETEKIEKPNAETKPNTKPIIELSLIFPKAIITIPIAAINIASQTFNKIFSLKNKKPNKAEINGIAAKQSNVIAALVFVIDQIKVIIAMPSPVPPIIPENPIL